MQVSIRLVLWFITLTIILEISVVDPDSQIPGINAIKLVFGPPEHVRFKNSSYMLFTNQIIAAESRGDECSSGAECTRS